MPATLILPWRETCYGDWSRSALTWRASPSNDSLPTFKPMSGFPTLHRFRASSLSTSCDGLAQTSARISCYLSTHRSPVGLWVDKYCANLRFAGRALRPTPDVKDLTGVGWNLPGLSRFWDRPVNAWLRRAPR